MSFFSRSRSKGYYPNANRGQSYYKRRGFFGRFVSGSSSGRMYPPYSQQGYQDTMAAQNYAAQSNFSSQNTAVTVCPKCGTSIPANSKFAYPAEKESIRRCFALNAASRFQLVLNSVWNAGTK